ncbi:MAG: hypothetical protein ACI9RO_000245 [Alteromonas macleodii]|jgi:hypothetical protein
MLNWFFAQNGLMLKFPLPQPNLTSIQCVRNAMCCEAIEDCGADLVL